MRYALNLLYLSLLTVASPWLVYAAMRHGKYRTDLWQRLSGQRPGLPSVDDASTQRIWIHAVSVGEVNQLGPLIDGLLRERPDASISISAGTDTGLQLAQRLFSQHHVFRMPLDFSWAMENTIRHLRPHLILLTETEIWPNLIRSAEKHGVPLALINARLSDHSAKGYAWIQPLMAATLNRIALITAQSESDAHRLQSIGARCPMQVTGSIKFDNVIVDPANADTAKFRRL
ncbi:MAG: glycosyltransferase N-terminal domain-containing protein, partial [Planctomycetota bacterium]